MGDVCGKGPDAAAVTALARYTLRAAAMRERLPSRSLGLLNEALLRQRDDRRFCTVAYAYLEPLAEGARIGFASGGHPLPLLLRADGTVQAVGEPGTLLGVLPDPSFEDRSLSLAPGDALVFYTDGVIEGRGPNGAARRGGARGAGRRLRGRRARTRSPRGSRTRPWRPRTAARATTSRCSCSESRPDGYPVRVQDGTRCPKFMLRRPTLWVHRGKSASHADRENAASLSHTGIAESLSGDDS